MKTLTPVLSWQEHDRRHPRDPFSTNTGRTYVLDETGKSGVLACGRCGCQVIEREARP